jgi:hypothetical protein
MYLSFLKIKKTIEIKGSERSLFISFRGLSCKAKPRKDHSSFLRSRKEEFRKEKGLAFFLLQIFFSFLKKANEANQILLVQRLEHLPSKLIIQVRVL